jgi:hypothetical protein
MPRVDVQLDTDVAPEAVRSALLDFSDRRPELWPGITPSLYKVFEVGDTWADIQEGTRMPGGGVWAIEHYDWSDPETVKWTVKESNFCKPGSFVSATITPRPGGGSHIHVIWNRTPSSFMGRVTALGIRLTGGKPVAASIRQGLAKIKERESKMAPGA